MADILFDLPDFASEADVVEDAGDRQAYRETEPDPDSPESGLEAEQVCGRYGDYVIAYECHEHYGFYILYPAQGIAEAQLQSVSELVGKQYEKQ